MSYEPRTIQSFVTLSESLSFTKAAEQLGVTQPHLSARIKGLEQQLGFALFSRTSRRVEITPAGLEFLNAAKCFLAEAENLKRIGANVRNGRSASIRIGTGNCHPTVRWSLLGSFMHAYPHVELKIRLYQNSSEFWAALRTGEVDVALVAPPVPDEFDYLTLSTANGGLLMRADSPLAHTSTVNPEWLDGQQIAIFPRKLFPALYDQVLSRLEGYGAWFSELPETGIECMSSFVRATGIPAMGAPWWHSEAERPADLVHRCIDRNAIPLNSVLMRSRARSSSTVNLLWRIAEGMAKIDRARTLPAHAIAETGRGAPGTLFASNG